MKKKTMFEAQKERLKSKPNISTNLRALMTHNKYLKVIMAHHQLPEIPEGKLTQSKLSELTGIHTQSIGNILQSPVDVRASMLLTLTHFFIITERQLVGEDPLNLDAACEGINPSIPSTIKRIPYIAWKEVLTFIDDEASRPENVQPYNSVANDRNLSKNAFAIRTEPFMKPLHSDGGVLLIDPDKEITDGALALVTLDGVEIEIKKILKTPNKIYLEDIKKRFLKKNKEESTLIIYDDQKHRILGVVMELRIPPSTEV